MKEIYEDTIVGISTPYAKGAIAIIRLSGNNAIQIVNKVFVGDNLLETSSHTIHYGHIKDLQNSETIDEVLVSVFKAPRTYTKEDVVEVNCHGGLFITNQIYETLVMAGARPAEAGEFTKRAFLNGRIDLTKAEAVMDIIEAENKTAVKIANQGIKGKIFEKVNNFRQRMLNIIATISVNIDYPEYDDVEQLTNKQVLPQIIAITNELKTLLDNSKNAIYLKNGIDTVIVGSPNVGKSTLLNALLKEDKAIVTNVPGTTRDIVEGKLNVGNITLNLIDTAGIRKTKNVVEKIGVDKTKEKLENAEVVLLILDGSLKLTTTDKKLITDIGDKPHIIIVNKSDLNLQITKEELPKALFVSAHEACDIQKIEDEISKLVLKTVEINKDATYLSNARQISKLNEAINDLEEAIQAISENAYIDFVDIYIRNSYNHLGEIVGETSSDNLINELFSKFCLGK